MEINLRLSKIEYNIILPELLIIQKKLGSFKSIENLEKQILIKS